MSEEIKFLRPAEAAQVLGVSKQTLAHWRMSGAGPRFVRAGRIILYDPKALERWAEALTVGSTAEVVPSGTRRGR
jgi:predicted site-specific integrase-resolvase